MNYTVTERNKNRIVFQRTDVEPFAMYGGYQLFSGTNHISAAEEAYNLSWGIAHDLCKAAGADPQTVKMIVKLQACDKRRFQEILKERGCHVEQGEAQPAMSVGWTVNLTPEQEKQLGNQYAEYKLKSSNDANKEE